jgi:hypothetical protein
MRVDALRPARIDALPRARATGTNEHQGYAFAAAMAWRSRTALPFDRRRAMSEELRAQLGQTLAAPVRLSAYQESPLCPQILGFGGPANGDLRGVGPCGQRESPIARLDMGGLSLRRHLRRHPSEHRGFARRVAAPLHQHEWVRCFAARLSSPRIGRRRQAEGSRHGLSRGAPSSREP